MSLAPRGPRGAGLAVHDLRSGAVVLAMQQRRNTFLTHEIHLHDIESGARTVHRHGDDDREPVWLRDGTGLVFQSQVAGTSGLWWQPFTAGRASGSARLLLEGFEGDLLNASSRDGSLPYLSNRGKSAIFVADFDAQTGQVRGRPRRVTEHVEGESLAPAWSPDGKSLALVSVRMLTGLPQRGRLVILTDAKTIVHPLDFGVARGTGPAWSADGKSLFLPGSDPGSTTENIERLYRVDAITGKSAAVPIAHVVNTKLRVGRSFPVLTPDSRLAYVSRAGELFRADVATGEREEQGIFRWAEREVLYSLALSPDGRRLAFGLPRRDAPPGLAVMPAAGGTPEIVHAGQGVNLRGFGGISWEPGGRHLLVVSGDEVMRFSLDDRKLAGTGLKVPGLSLPSLNPSATQIVYQVSRPKVELWSVDVEHLLTAGHR